MTQILLLLGLGLIAGTISGVFGIGAGVVVTPALLWICGMTQATAQGVAYTVMVPMAILGAWRYHNQPTLAMDWKVIGLIASTCLIGVWLGTHLAFIAEEHILRRAFGAYLLAMGAYLLLGSR